jgi:hypothetical protein
MASGLSLILKSIRRDFMLQPRETVSRDRSLRGKARIRARKDRQRARSRGLH